MTEIIVQVPGSKSITQRALVCAALAGGQSVLEAPLRSEDPILLKEALAKLGVKTEETPDSWLVHGTGGELVVGPGVHSIFMGNNGTGIRFLAALACLAKGQELDIQTIEITGTKRMAQRPIEPLLQALRTLGAHIESRDHTGCPPVVLQPKGVLTGGKAQVDASSSSQYLSALLLIAPYTDQPTEILLKGPLASSPYLSMTLKVMEAFGIRVSCDRHLTSFKVEKGRYSHRQYFIEGDASSASYFFAGAAVTGRTVTVENLPVDSMQGDARFTDILEKMGCSVRHTASGTTVQGPGPGGLKGIEVSMKDMPDMVPTLAAIAPFAKGDTVITDCPHLRIKETDRLAAMACELTKIGVDVKELPDGLVLRGGARLRPAAINTYDDHRIAMSFAVVRLYCQGIEIQDPGCVKKSFPDFWDRWKMAWAT